MTHPLIRSWGYSWASLGRSPKTMAVMLPLVEQFETTLAGGLMTSTRQDCEQFIASFDSPFRANYAWRSLRSFYAFVAEEEECASPMAKVKAPKVPLTDVTVATEDDVSRLLRHISPFKSFTASRDAAMVSLLWASGLRRSELAALEVSDIDLDARAVLVRRSKNGTSRWVPFDDRTAHHLARYLAKRELHAGCHAAGMALWLGKCGPLKSDGVRLMLVRRCKEAGVNISAHSFRRGLAARALRKGVSQSSLMNICGWKNPTMITRYTRTVAAEIATEEYRRLLG